MAIIRSLSRGLKALEFFSQAGTPLRLTDLAQALAVEKANASHLVQTLVDSGYVRQGRSRRYELTDKIQTLAQRSLSIEQVIECKQRWRPKLEELVKQSGECAHLAVLAKTHVWYVDKVESPLPLKVDHPIGTLSPLHCTALGKAFLAFGNAQFPSEFPRYTKRTLTTLKALEREIELSQARGFTLDDSEFTDGIRCVAVPLYDNSDRMVAAIGVSGPSARIDNEAFVSLANLVVNTIGRKEA
ncbi:MAG: IclR family transcriptional regulator [Balneolaceae bacterium]|nr:IclR family transcriptional regulator [Balneolaceae bacterium]